jgi:ABC-type Mn2+/Zn2+ transport system permease subunit
MLFAERLGPRLAIGWGMGALVSGLGVWLSFKLDLPTGATIVATFGGTLWGGRAAALCGAGCRTNVGEISKVESAG